MRVNPRSNNRLRPGGGGESGSTRSKSIRGVARERLDAWSDPQARSEMGAQGSGVERKSELCAEAIELAPRRSATLKVGLPTNIGGGCVDVRQKSEI